MDNIDQKDRFTYLKEIEKFPFIRQAPNYCVPCSIENLLKFNDFNYFDQFKLGSLLDDWGFVPFKNLLSEILKNKFIFILKRKEDLDHDTPEKVFKNIKDFINDNNPVAVSFYSKDDFGNPTNRGAHIRIAIAFNDEKIRFFEQETGKEIEFDMVSFKIWLNKDHHCLMIRKI